MNIIKLFLEAYGDEIIHGLALNQGMANKQVKKYVNETLNSLLGGLLQASADKAGLKKTQLLLSEKKYNGAQLKNISDKFTGPASLKLTKQGLEVLPQIFGSDDKVADILSTASNVFDGGISRAQSFFSMLAPLLLGFIGKHFQKEKLNANSLQQLFKNQYATIENNLDEGLLDALDLSAYYEDEPEDDIETTTENNTTINKETIKKPAKKSVKKKNGLPIWAWAAICILPVIALFSLTMMCGEPPEQTHFGNKNKKANAKNRLQTKVKPKTDVAKINPNAQNTQNTQNIQNIQKPINITKPLNNNTTKNNPTISNNKPNSAKNIQRPVTQNNNNNNNNNNNKANTTASQNQAKPNANAAAQTPKAQTLTSNQQPVNANEQQPKSNTNKPANSKQATAPSQSTPANKPATNVQKTAVNKSDVQSNYRGSARKVDIAAQTNSTEIINFGTVTNNNKTLTPSSYSNFLKIASILTDNPKASLTLRTHNRDYKNAKENESAKNQGKVRADMLKKILVDSGVATNRIKVELMGHDEPLITQDPGHIRNKRVSVKIN